jgi:ParB family chromosome partitioning protein
MSNLPEVTPDPTAGAPDPDQPDTGAPPPAGTDVVRMMIPVSELTAHPGNVREDLELTPEFCASIANAGVRVPLLVTATSDGGYRVIEGHRRLAAAAKAGLETVPCDVDPGRTGDEAGQYLDMVLANGDAYRKNFVPAEEAAALFAAHEAGASRTRIRKATGRKAEEIKAALTVAQISPETRSAAGDLTRQLDLEHLALLAEFDGDVGAVSRILDALHRGYNVQYEAERIRQQRAEAAEHQQLLDELQAAGVQITTELPPGAVRLSQLLHDGEDLTPETHATCPGRGAYFISWDLRNAIYYCASPEEHGHTLRASLSPRPTPPAADGAVGGDTPEPGMPPSPADEPPDPTRRLVIEGNKAWQAAAEVRKRWLADELFARRAAPREIAQFIARQLLTMPEPLRTGLSIAPGRMSFTEVTRQDAGKWLEICGTTTGARLPLLILAPIAVTYEYAMTQSEGRNTWRTDNRYSPCPRTQAGEYLAFLASIGHTLTPIEQAVADDVPWTGDTPVGTLADPSDEPASDEETDSAMSGVCDDGQPVAGATGDIGEAAA